MAFSGPLEDRVAIRELIDAYADATMLRDEEAWAALWAEDACWQLPDFPTMETRSGRKPLSRCGPARSVTTRDWCTLRRPARSRSTAIAPPSASTHRRSTPARQAARPSVAAVATTTRSSSATGAGRSPSTASASCTRSDGSVSGRPSRPTTSFGHGTHDCPGAYDGAPEVRHRDRQSDQPPASFPSGGHPSSGIQFSLRRACQPFAIEFG